MKLKTLLAQLRPDIVAALETNRNKYDLAITEIYNTLDNKYLYSELTVGDMRDLTTYADVNFYNWDSTDWRYGTKLFKN